MKKNKNKHNYICEHLTMNEECDEYDSKIDYYDMFWKMYLMNEIKRKKVDMFQAEIEKLKNDINWT